MKTYMQYTSAADCIINILADQDEKDAIALFTEVAAARFDKASLAKIIADLSDLHGYLTCNEIVTQAPANSP
jgi:hypothetical protein